ncbi:hypothetical protein APHAL10511_002783 [Amanita phalloides]|nr:hypothetical protein APHAL10511_002783 [Amanita phalloides]
MGLDEAFERYGYNITQGFYYTLCDTMRREKILLGDPSAAGFSENSSDGGTDGSPGSPSGDGPSHHESAGAGMGAAPTAQPRNTSHLDNVFYHGLAQRAGLPCPFCD